MPHIHHIISLGIEPRSNKIGSESGALTIQEPRSLTEYKVGWFVDCVLRPIDSKVIYDLETAPLFTVPCEGLKLGFYTFPTGESNPGLSCGSPLHYRCAHQLHQSMEKFISCFSLSFSLYQSKIAMSYSLHNYFTSFTE